MPDRTGLVVQAVVAVSLWKELVVSPPSSDVWLLLCRLLSVVVYRLWLRGCCHRYRSRPRRATRRLLSCWFCRWCACHSSRCLLIASVLSCWEQLVALLAEEEASASSKVSSAEVAAFTPRLPRFLAGGALSVSLLSLPADPT